MTLLLRSFYERIQNHENKKKTNQTTEASIKDSCLNVEGQEQVNGIYTEEKAVTKAKSGPNVLQVYFVQGVSCMSKCFVICRLNYIY